jgi:hypothetical protein
LTRRDDRVAEDSDAKRTVTEDELAGVQWLGVAGDEDGPQIAVLPDGHRVMRHGGDPDAPYLVFTPDEWEAFEQGAAVGEFDNLKAQHAPRV